MNKKTIIMFLLALVAATGQAQKIKMNKPSFSDYLPLLNANGQRERQSPATMLITSFGRGVSFEDGEVSTAP